MPGTTSARNRRRSHRTARPRRAARPAAPRSGRRAASATGPDSGASRAGSPRSTPPPARSAREMRRPRSRPTVLPRGKTALWRSRTAGMEYRTYPNTDVTVSDGRLRPLDDLDRLVGRHDRRRGGRDDARSRTISASRSSTPPTRTATGAAKTSSPRPSATAATRSCTRRSSDTTGTTTRASAKGSKRLSTTFRRRSCATRSRQSLKRLETDYIDIWQMHNAHLEQVRDDELWELLDDLRARGQTALVGRRARAGHRLALRRRRGGPERDVTAIQMIQNILEPFPGDAMIDAADRCRAPTPAS